MTDVVTATVLAEHRNAYGEKERKAPAAAEDAVSAYDLPRAVAEQLKAQGLIDFDAAPQDPAPPASGKAPAPQKDS